MKLFVDDLRNAPDDSWHVARTITEAIRILHSSAVIEELSLDHDMGHSEETYVPVAMYAAEKYGFNRMLPPRVIIHTGNPVGAERMYQIFKSVGMLAYCIPYEDMRKRP